MENEYNYYCHYSVWEHLGRGRKVKLMFQLWFIPVSVYLCAFVYVSVVEKLMMRKVMISLVHKLTPFLQASEEESFGDLWEQTDVVITKNVILLSMRSLV